MLVSLSWLRSICPADAGAAEVSRALTSRGLTVDGVADRGDDAVLDIDVPANRPDCLGHYGIARELGAALGVPLAERGAPVEGRGGNIDGVVTVDVDDVGLCPRYTATLVRDVRVGPSPPWVVARLEACGLRSVNNVVDVSNLVLLELSQPIHTFDLDRLRGPAIRVREAVEGETLRTLDGEEHRLGPGMLVIADADRPVALAGVMGGADTEIGEGTSTVLIEAASFRARSVRRTARSLGIATDASHRFERGVDAEGVPEAQAMAIRLLHEVAGGVPAPGMLDVYRGAGPPAELTVSRDKVRGLLGYDPGVEAMESALSALSLSPVRAGEDRLRVTVPSWRRDLEREADLVEEVARHLGYDRIPSHLPGAPGAPVETEAASEIEERARDLASRLGFHEAVNYAMVGEGEDAPFVTDSAPPAMSVVNPIAEPLSKMRRSVLPGLLRSTDRNLRRGNRDIRLFEVGRIFLPSTPGELPDEPLCLGLAWVGASHPRHWSGEVRDASIHHATGVVESLLGSLRPGGVFRRGPGGLPGLHPGRSASWTAETGRVVARAGELHPELLRKLDMGATVLLAEIGLSGLLDVPPVRERFAPLPRVPAVTRDLSLVVGADTPYEKILETLRGVPAPAATAFHVVDRFTGEGLGEGQSSLTVRVILQPFEKSLTDAETEAYRTELVRALDGTLGIRLR